MRPNLINRLKEEWNNLDPVDPLRGLIADAIDALTQPAPPECKTDAEKTAFAFGWWKALEENRKQPALQQEPYGWKVYGVNSLFMGEFAEADAKAEAKRIGGTCIAFPIYTSPPASKPLTGEQYSLAYWQHEINKARDEAYLQGFAAGKKEAKCSAG